MGKLNFRIHPLFFIFGLYFAAIGKVFSFLTFTLCAVLHEFGHAIAAEKSGYKLIKITLMPYGAIVSGDIGGIKYTDEIKVVAAGPAVNLLLATAILASFWLFPETYPYTEIALLANLSLFFVNLIPAYPLDGGRLLLATLSLFMKRESALRIVRVTGFAFAGILVAAFSLTAESDMNLSLAAFAVFLFFGTADMKKENSYERIYSSLSPERLKGGRKIKELAVTDDFTVKRLYSLIDGDALYRVTVYGANGKKRVLEPEDVASLLEKSSLYDKIITF